MYMKIIVLNQRLQIWERPGGPFVRSRRSRSRREDSRRVARRSARQTACSDRGAAEGVRQSGARGRSCGGGTPKETPQEVTDDGARLGRADRAHRGMAH